MIKSNDKEMVLAEAYRVLNICNICGYCNAFCAVFDIAKQTPQLQSQDLLRCAYICHDCRNCFYGCQYRPPHDLHINVPATLAALRHHVHYDSAWPRAGARLFIHPYRVGWSVLITVMLLMTGWIALSHPQVFWQPVTGPAGAFYEVIPYSVILWFSSLSLAWGLGALVMSGRRFWRMMDHDWPRLTVQRLRDVLHDLWAWRLAQGGGLGCNDCHEEFSWWRLRSHQLLIAGFGLCACASFAAFLLHHFFHHQAPYVLWSVPVLWGASGGLLLMMSLSLLLWRSSHCDSSPEFLLSQQTNRALLWLLMLVTGSGFFVLFWRETGWMALGFVVHFSAVLTFFMLLPYSKFVHAMYRLLVLLTIR
jgi:citrate/tricarballylate utilization protein